MHKLNAQTMNKIKFVLVALAASVLTLLVQPTLAFFAVSGRTTNVITTGNIHIAVVETMNGGKDPFPSEGVYILPGSVISKEVAVQNTGKHPCWVRVKLTNGIDREALSADVFDLNINRTDWTEYDGYYYYNKILWPQESTAYLFTDVTVSGQENDRYQGAVVTLTVTAYGVQSENNDSVQSVTEVQGWPMAQGGNT